MAEDITPTFIWKGVDRARRKITGEIQAENAQAARLLLRRRGIQVKRVRKRSKSLFSLNSKVKIQDIVFFTRQLATMMEAGIPIASSLRGITVGYENEAVKKLLNSIREDVETGTTLSASLKKFPKFFNTQYTSLINVGEESGTLDVMMEKIASYLEKMEHIKGKIKSALFYPALVIIVALVIVSILLIVVIPEFEALFSDYGSELPALTRLIVATSHTFQQHWVKILILAGLLYGGSVYLYRRSETMQYGLDQLTLSVPVFGLIIRKAIIARVSRTLATMFGAGVPLVDALETVAGATGNRVYTQAIIDIKREVSTGRNLEGAMMDTGLFPGLVLQMIATGEEAGELERMLDKIAEFYETEVDNAIAIISSLVEPFLIIFLGVIVGTIVIAMYLPIFKLGTVF